MSYKGYAADPIEFDEDAGLFSGTVVGLSDVVHFAGRTADEVSQAFRDSVDYYLIWCAERGKAPERPYRGRFPVRVTPNSTARLRCALPKRA